MKHYIGIAGTNSKASTNLKLMQYVKKHFNKDVEVELVDISSLPVFFKGTAAQVPNEALEMAAKIEAADGVIIATPEYDHSIPAVLMNALAWLSYTKRPFIGKPVMIIGASYGTLGASRAQAHLRRILDAPELSALVMPSSEYFLSHSLQAFDENGDLNDEQKVVELENLMKQFDAYIQFAKSIDLTSRQKSNQAQYLKVEE